MSTPDNPYRGPKRRGEKPAPPDRGRATGSPAGETTRGASTTSHAKELRQRMTDAEQRLWRDLRAGRLLEAKFRRQEPIGNYIADFVSFEHKLIVEAGGGQHSGSARDAARDRWFESQGFRVLRFWDDEILTRSHQVLDAIANALGERTLSPTPLPSRERGFGPDSGGASKERGSGPESRGGSKARGLGRKQSESSAVGALEPLSLDGKGVGERVRSGAGSPKPEPKRKAQDEIRLYGLNACRAAFAARPQDLRKVYLAESRIATLRDVLAFCVKHRLGYRVVDESDLDKLAASSHHEGVLFEMLRGAQPTLDELLRSLAPGPQVLLWLDGVGNPHNFGALLRSAAHFGSAGVLLPPASPLTLSGAACRIAEGGAEAVPVVRLAALDTTLVQLRQAGFVLAATLPAGGESIYSAALPPRLVLVFGAEGGGMQPALVEACALRLSIPGSGKVESLNIANAVGVMLGECWRRSHT